MPATGSVYRHITRSRIWQRGRRCVWTAAWPNTWTFMSGWDASWRSSPSRMRSWWGKQLLAADKDWWRSECRHALWRGGGIWQAASSPEVEDTTHLRKDVIIYLSNFATVFGCVEREGRSRNYVFVCHLEQVQTNTKITSRLDSVPPLNVFF